MLFSIEKNDAKSLNLWLNVCDKVEEIVRCASLQCTHQTISKKFFDDKNYLEFCDLQNL
jgi:hypothetical protein